MCCIGLLLLLAVHPVFAGQETGDSPGDPVTRYQSLSRKRDLLKAEQELLRFKKTFYEADSKYLILDLAAGKGMLMYRNRVLRAFSLVKMNRESKDPEYSSIRMTRKVDGSLKTRALIFGDSFSLHGNIPGNGKLPTGYGIGSKDLAALFFTLEVGAIAFVK